MQETRTMYVSVFPPLFMKDNAPIDHLKVLIFRYFTYGVMSVYEVLIVVGLSAVRGVR